MTTLGPIFDFNLHFCLEGQLVRAGLSEFLPSAGDSGRGQLGGDHTNVAAPGSGEQGGPGRRSERQQLHFCPEAGVSFYREDGGWSEK